MQKQKITWRLPALALLAALAASCTDGASPTADGARARFALRPQFHIIDADAASTIQRARVTILDSERGDQVAGPFIIDLDPQAASWSLPVSFDPPAGRAAIVALVELLNVNGDAERAEWSGRTSSVSLSNARNAPVTVGIDMYPGPPANLSVTSVRIAPHAGSILEGDSIILAAAIIGPPDARLYWTTSDTSVAIIDGDGRLRSLRDGTITVRAQAGPSRDSALVHVSAQPVAVRLTPDSARASSLGEAVTFVGMIVDRRANAVADDILWSAADTTVARPSVNGAFKALRNGSTDIYATSAGTPSLRAVGRITVRQRVANISLDRPTIELDRPGARYTFAAVTRDALGNAFAAPLTWSSSDASVVAVDNAGTITGMRSGTATITASSSDGPATSATVTVRQAPRPPISVTVSPAQSQISVGGQAMLVAFVENDTIGPLSGVTWSSSDDGIVTVDGSGLVTASAPGVATITAASRLDPAKTATAQIEVFASGTIALSPASANLIIGDVVTISASLSGTPQFVAAGVRYSSSNTAVATVNATSGEVTAVAAGSVHITATSNSDPSRTAVAALTVDASPIVVQSIRTSNGGQVDLNNVKGTIVVSATITAATQPIRRVEIGIDARVECTNDYSPNITAGQGSRNVTCSIDTSGSNRPGGGYSDGQHVLFIHAIGTNGIIASTRINIRIDN